MDGFLSVLLLLYDIQVLHEELDTCDSINEERLRMSGLICREWWRPHHGFPHSHTQPSSLVGPSAPTLLAEQSTSPQMLIFGSQWLRLFPPWPLGCVDILLKESSGASKIIFHVIYNCQRQSVLCSKSFKILGVISLKSWLAEKVLITIILCNKLFSKDIFKEQFIF